MPKNIIFLQLCTKNDNYMMYGSWDMERDNIFCHHLWSIFSFYPNSPVNQNFGKMKKKTPGDIIILHICTINDNHKMYGYWDMECDT